MIKIEVTGSSIPEVADKLIAIGRSLYNTSVNDADNAARETMQAERKKVKGEATAAPTVAGTGSTIETKEDAKVSDESPTEASTASEQPEQGKSGSEPDAPTTGETMNFDLDVAPVVLRAVAAKGKPFVMEVLAEFGAARASDMDESLWPELVNRLEAEIA